MRITYTHHVRAAAALAPIESCSNRSTTSTYVRLELGRSVARSQWWRSDVRTCMESLRYDLTTERLGKSIANSVDMYLYVRFVFTGLSSHNCEVMSPSQRVSLLIPLPLRRFLPLFCVLRGVPGWKLL